MNFISFILISVLPMVCLPHLPMDFNNNGIVDFLDFATFAGEWLEEPGLKTTPLSDFNNDGIVDFLDFATFTNKWLEESGLEISPLFEFDSNSAALVVGRNSAAVQENPGDFCEVAANVVRTKPVCVVSPLTISDLFNYKPLEADSARELVLCTESAPGNNPVQHLYTTSDGNTFTEIVDISRDFPFRTYYEAMTYPVSITSAAVLDGGSWLLALGPGHAWEGSTDPELVKPNGRLYRSEDAGQTWEMVLNMTYGYVPEWGWGGISGKYIVVAEYGYKTETDPSHNPCKVYLSEDYGRNWKCIYTLEPVYNRHIHQAVFAPNSEHTKIYITTGDPLKDYPDPVKMYRLDKQQNGTWAIGTIVGNIQPCGVITVGNSIYWGCDERALGGIIVRRRWKDDDVEKMEPVLRMPEPDVSGLFPYSYIFDKGHVFSIYRYDGVYYAAVSDEQTVGGIYVSSDLKNWVCAYHINENWGCRIIAGYANGRIWANIRTGNDNISKGFSFSPVSAKTVKAIQCERGVTNILNTADESTFTSSIGRWGFYGDADIKASGYTTEEGLHGNSCFNLVYDANGTLPQNYTVVYPDWFRNLGGNPKKGDIVTCTFWMKAADTWPRKYKAVAAWKFGTGVSNKFLYDKAELFNLFPGTWCKYTIVAKTLDDINLNENFRMEVGIRTEGEPKTSDAVVYIDCVQVTYSADRYNSSSSFQIGGIQRDNETAVLPLCGVGGAFTVVFEWHPGTAHNEFLADIPIASWIGADGSYLNLFWECASKRLKLTDGIYTIHSGEESYPFMFADYIRFAVVSDNIGSILYIQDPINGTVTIGDGSVVKLGAEPVLLKLGTNEGQSDFGCGCFCNIAAWDLKLSYCDILERFRR
jgi:hypothetical protein